MDIGLLLLRLLLAGLLAGHSTQKLFGWFSGLGRAKTATIFEEWGFRPGATMVLVAGLCELVGVGSVALGLLTPGGCAVIVGTMIVAASPTAGNGLWAHLGGCEVPVAYAGFSAVLAFTGPGAYSLDHAFGLTGLNGVGWGVAAVIVGAVASVPPLLRRRAALRDSSAPTAG
jgi:putative oxidoreductase